jgi:hypothetical protein
MDTVKHCNEVQAQQLPFQLAAAATVLARGTIIKKESFFIIVPLGVGVPTSHTVCRF